MTCILCGGTASRLLYFIDGQNIVECPVCNLAFVERSCDSFDPSSIYTREYFHRGGKYLDSGYKAQDKNNHLRLQIVESWGPRGGKLLDVGCATGSFMALARDKLGWQVYGVELSEYAAEQARNNLGSQVITGDFLRAHVREEFFDLITMWDVLGHFQNPLLALKKAWLHLKPGGLLMVATCDISSLFARISGRHWHLLTPGQHLFFFNPRTMDMLIRETGFDLLDMRHYGKYFNLDFALMKCSEHVKNRTMCLLAKVLRKTPLARLTLYCNFRDVMTVVAAKAGDNQ